jgi:hypothetical protein
VIVQQDLGRLGVPVGHVCEGRPRRSGGDPPAARSTARSLVTWSSR